MQPTAPAAADAPAKTYRPNQAGRLAFIKDVNRLIYAGDYAAAVDKVITEADALGPRKPKWLAAVQWYRDARPDFTDEFVALRGGIALGHAYPNS